VPSGAVGTRVEARASPTIRSSSTIASPTMPSGPSTLPTIVIGPGPIAMVVVVAPATGLRGTPV
jgi:hypothetical protein